MDLPKTLEELKNLIKKEIEKEIETNLTIEYYEGSEMYGIKESGSIKLYYKGEVIAETWT